MATKIGLPTLTITFQRAAEDTTSQLKSGVVGVIVRDAKAHGVYQLISPTLIPSELGANNITHIKGAFEGSDRGQPGKVVLLVIATGTEDTSNLEAGLPLLEGVVVDYLAGPPDVTEDEMAVLTDWVKAQRKAYKPVKLVRPYRSAGSDDMGIIEVDEADMKDKDGAVTAAEFCARLAGILAGIPVSMSATNVAIPELASVTKRTKEEQEEAIKAGKLILIHDGIQAKIARAVNSLTTIPKDGAEDWSKIKIVQGMDTISYYLHSTIDSSYVGRYANTYDNKQLLVAAIQDYFNYLEAANVLASGSSFVEVDYEGQLKWLTDNKVDTSGMSRQQVLEAQTGSWVFLRCGGRLVDAMEDFTINFETM